MLGGLPEVGSAVAAAAGFGGAEGTVAALAVLEGVRAYDCREVGQLRNVSLQVMPTEREDHAGMHGLIQVLKFGDGTAVGRSDGAFNGRPVSDPKDLRILELRYGMIRAQALTPRESLAFIERALGET